MELEEKPLVKAEQSKVKEEAQGDGGDSREVQGEMEDKKPPMLEPEEVKREGRKREREHGGRSGAQDSDSSATCSADEVEETDSTEKNRCVYVCVNAEWYGRRCLDTKAFDWMITALINIFQVMVFYNQGCMI